jgi:hypothetical protein
VVNFRLKGKIEAKENGVDYMIKQFGNEVLVYAFEGKEHAVECNFIELREAMKYVREHARKKAGDISRTYNQTIIGKMKLGENYSVSEIEIKNQRSLVSYYRKTRNRDFEFEVYYDNGKHFKITRIK